MGLFKKRGAARNATGTLYEWPGGRNVLGYFKDGAVYTENMHKIGSYESVGGRYNFLYAGKVVGSYSPSGTGGLIYWFKNYPTGMEKVAEHWGGQEYIQPDDADIQTVIFKGDPIGAAAAFVVLCYGHGQFDTPTRQRFRKR